MTIQLIHDTISRDTAEAAAVIKGLVDSGEVTGMFFGLRFRGGRYMVNVAGRCAADPTYARGMLGALEDELSRMIQGKADSDTTL
jgi:hypothetical protein